MRFLGPLAVLSLLFIFGCGANPISPSTFEPTSVSSSNTLSVVTPPPTSISFAAQYTYEDGVSTSDRQIIEDAVTLGQNFFRSQIGIELRGNLPIVVRATDCGFAAFATNQRVEVCTLSTKWTLIGRTKKTQAIAHELTHILQFQNTWSLSNRWLTEGAAEYLGFMAIQSMASYQQVKDCRISLYFNQGGGSIPPLSQLDMSMLSSPGVNGYVMPWLGVDKLTGGVSGISKIASMLRGSSFDSVYGVSIDQFYQDFETSRQALVATPSNSCVPLAN